MKFTLLFFATLVIMAAGYVYCQPASASLQGIAIAIGNFTYQSPVVTVAQGTRVTWTNNDDIPHTVTDDDVPPSYRSHALDTGDTYSVLFDKKGTFHYFCSLHPRMRGTVVVQ